MKPERKKRGRGENEIFDSHCKKKEARALLLGRRTTTKGALELGGVG
jgi:hypothetical protein